LNPRNHCPSCHYRITPLVLECPQCGLSLARQPLPRPLLFQASALKTLGPAKGEPQSLATPALGRVEPMAFLEPAPDGSGAVASVRGEEALASQAPAPEAGLPAADLEITDSFWPVVRMEALECLALLALNALLMGIACWTAGAAPAAVYSAFWAYLLPVHFAVSWAYLMVPLVLVGQSPMMGHQGLLLDTDLPERRMSFAVLHLVSALGFPLSFLCMVLTPGHRTLAELVSGLEILQLPERKVR
jgi:hypothetical protein